MNMKQLLIALLFSCLPVAANAITISFDPATPTVGVGDSVSVDVVISGLGNFVAPSLGAYDIDVAFDASILNLATVTFGTHMGIFTLTGLGPIAVGINVFEISLEPPATLDALQPDSFTLFTLTFDALAAGTSGLTANVNALADAFGGSLDATTEDGSVTVPEPATLGLLGAGLIGIAWRRRRKA